MHDMLGKVWFALAICYYIWYTLSYVLIFDKLDSLPNEFTLVYADPCDMWLGNLCELFYLISNLYGIMILLLPCLQMKKVISPSGSC